MTVKRVRYRMEEKKNNKKTRNAFEDKLRRQRVLIIVLPIIGPLLGLATCFGLNSGHQDAGKKVNFPADNHSSDSD
ncbi:hypothetical protein MHM98_07005 [Psychrobium sp. MM17-31]|uniref:hypothetical protein n=1 Tax=Psychrobium sp. MM17-31 TaxID=2917758 RepID=UPI001EF5B0AB|nr:hypothetical protein [Psychrobium sp. MM17-31]MCG7531098.1 hypothetical protein [Psychrobium sp. MM17-31]